MQTLEWCWIPLVPLLTLSSRSRSRPTTNYGVDPPISVEVQFFLTLIKLRANPTNKELGIFFCLNEKQASNVFIPWMNFMCCQWEEIQWWLSRDLVGLQYALLPPCRLPFKMSCLKIYCCWNRGSYKGPHTTCCTTSHLFPHTRTETP